MTVTRVFTVALLLAFLSSGCRSPEGEERWPGAVSAFDEAGERFAPESVRIAPELPPVGATEAEIAALIASRHVEMLDDLPSARVLAEAELVFLANGNLPDLLGYYEEALARGQTEPRLAARVAWLYQRLGQEDVALQRARAALAESPDDAFANFALAFTLGQQSDRFEDPFHDVILLLTRVFELEPGFEVAGVVSNNALRAELARLEREHDHDHSHESLILPSDDAPIAP